MDYGHGASTLLSLTLNHTHTKIRWLIYLLFGIPGSNLQRIINDSCADVDSNSTDFWVMVAALKVIT